MRKKNSSDHKMLKMKYLKEKKSTQRRVKFKKDKKKSPNKHHKKNSDPANRDILAERGAALELKADISTRKTVIQKKARVILRDAAVAFKRKMPEGSGYGLGLTIKKTSFDNGVTNDEDMIGDNMDDDNMDENMDDNMDNTDDKIDDNKDADNRAIVCQQKIQAMKMKEKACQRLMEWQELHKETTHHGTKTELDTSSTKEHTHYSEVRKVVSACDILLEVVDARDPLGTRCSILETLIKNSPGKKLVLIVNKADLIPKANLEDWLKYLRVDAPTIAFKAAIGPPTTFKKSIDRILHIGEECARTSSSMGVDVLIQLLKNYARSSQFAALTVGVVGLPNVGKSSLINSLKKMKVCSVSATPGETKGLRQIKLDKKLFMIDSPGVVFPGKDMSPVEAALKNVVNFNKISDPVLVAHEIFKRCDPMQLFMFYELRKVDTFEEFLMQMARRSKSMKKGGIIDQTAGAFKIIYDWNHGYLKHYTEPPKRDHADVKTKVVSTTSSVFNADPISSTSEGRFISTDTVENCDSVGLHNEDETNDYDATNVSDIEEESDIDSNVEESVKESESLEKLPTAIEMIGSDLEED